MSNRSTTGSRSPEVVGFESDKESTRARTKARVGSAGSTPDKSQVHWGARMGVIFSSEGLSRPSAGARGVTDPRARARADSIELKAEGDRYGLTSKLLG